MFISNYYNNKKILITILSKTNLKLGCVKWIKKSITLEYARRREKCQFNKKGFISLEKLSVGCVNFFVTRLIHAPDFFYFWCDLDLIFYITKQDYTFNHLFCWKKHLQPRKYDIPWYMKFCRKIIINLFCDIWKERRLMLIRQLGDLIQLLTAKQRNQPTDCQ